MAASGPLEADGSSMYIAVQQKSGCRSKSVIINRLKDSVYSYPLKSNRRGASSILAKGPTVGGKTRRTGAVWSINYSMSANIIKLLGHIFAKYLLKGAFSIGKVKGPKEHLKSIGLGTFVPASCYELPFRLKLATKDTPIASICGCQKHCNMIVARLRCYVFVRRVGQFDWSGARE